MASSRKSRAANGDLPHLAVAAEQPAAVPDASGPIGRDTFLVQLRQAIDGALAGRGRLTLLTGEAGIGKTTMLLEAARHAETGGARVVWGWGWPGPGAPGYWPWIQVLRAMDATLDPTTPLDQAPASARFQLFDEVSSTLLAEAAKRPLLVVLDDLQWADQPSLLLLDFLARRLATGACAVIGAYREAPLLAALAARNTVLPLAGLPVEAVARLAGRTSGLALSADEAVDLHRRTGGNPFFVEQLCWLIKDGRPGVPPGAREALEERFAAFDAGSGWLLSVAAVIGHRFPAELLARATGGASAVIPTLAAAVRVGVLVQDEPDRFRFAHDLFREHAYERLGSAERAEAHRIVGLALEVERAGGGEVSLAELAGHFVRADPASEQAGRFSVGAAREATGRLAYEEAVQHWQRALSAVGDALPTRTDRLLELAEAQRRAGTGDAAVKTFRRAADLARRDGDPPRLARAALGVHAIGSRVGEPPDELIELLGAAIDGLGRYPRNDHEALRLRVMASLARVLAWHDLDLPRARAIAADAVAAARRLGDPRALADCLLAEHHALWAPDTAGRRNGLAGEIAALATTLDDRELLLEARLLTAADRLELADPGFRAALEEFLVLADASAQPRFRHAGLVRRAMLALLSGRLPEAEALIEQAASLGRECGEPGARDVYAAQLWNLRTMQGRRGELLDLIGQSYVDPYSRQARGSRVLVRLASGEHFEDPAGMVREWLASADQPAPDSRRWLADATYGAEVAVALDDRSLVEHFYRLLVPHGERGSVVGVAVAFNGVIEHHLGVLAARLDRPELAIGHLTRAVAAHAALGAEPWRLRSRFELARLRLSGQPEGPDGLSDELSHELSDELSEVARDAHRLGLAQLARDAEAAGGQRTVASGVFSLDGTLWTLTYGGATVRLRDTKGLRDLATLLAAPGEPVRSVDLAAAAGARGSANGSAIGAGDVVRADLDMGADEVFDRTARQQIRARLTDLDEEIAEARQWADQERAARAQAERDALISALSAAVGLSGSPRRLGDQWERARKAVTARIRDAIGRIERAHPALGSHLRASVTTGTNCTYSPAVPVLWRFTPPVSKS